MKLLRALAASFSLYSRFPTPRFQWTEDDFRRCLVFLPCVGLAIGAIILGVAALFNVVEIPLIGRMTILSAIPLSRCSRTSRPNTACTTTSGMLDFLPFSCFRPSIPFFTGRNKHVSVFAQIRRSVV